MRLQPTIWEVTHVLKYFHSQSSTAARELAKAGRPTATVGDSGWVRWPGGVGTRSRQAVVWNLFTFSSRPMGRSEAATGRSCWPPGSSTASSEKTRDGAVSTRIYTECTAQGRMYRVYRRVFGKYLFILTPSATAASS